VQLDRARVALIAESYAHFAGRPLLPKSDLDVLEAMWVAPFCIVAHDTAADPIFFFANLTALQLFEMDFASFTKLPSRYSAEPLVREERARLLERVNRDGLIDDYSGVRITATGKRFRIRQASVWNLVDSFGANHGQAAAFRDWTPIVD
jgi:hypothetical protein